jgi:exodeoxyribonuclease VII small subunit
VASKKKTPEFEKSLAELEQLVGSLEKGDLSLEQSLATFETGIKLTRECQTRLVEAEQKVQLLVEEQGQLSAAPFDDDEQ